MIKMDEKIKESNKNFHEFLRNSQPLAFLASFSMIIAVFAFPNKEFEIVYTNATLSASMFIISFVSSYLSQFLVHREEQEGYKEPFPMFESIRYGSYFFFAVGVIYLILIVVEFAKNLDQIPNIIIGWVWLFAGISLLIAIIRNMKSLKKQSKTFIIDVSFVIISAIASVSSLGVAANNLFKGFLMMDLGLSFFTYIALVGMVFMVMIVFVFKIILKIR